MTANSELVPLGPAGGRQPHEHPEAPKITDRAWQRSGRSPRGRVHFKVTSASSCTS